jgi:hypothetical protein
MHPFDLDQDQMISDRTVHAITSVTGWRTRPLPDAANDIVAADGPVAKRSGGM